MLAFAAERLMELEVETTTGAAKGVRSALRTAQRNGYRERGWQEGMVGYLRKQAGDNPAAFMALLGKVLSSTNPLERVNKEVKRRSDVVGIFPNDDAVIQLVGGLMVETNDMDRRPALHGRGKPRPGSPILTPSGCRPCGLLISLEPLPGTRPPTHRYCFSIDFRRTTMRSV